MEDIPSNSRARTPTTPSYPDKYVAQRAGKAESYRKGSDDVSVTAWILPDYQDFDKHLNELVSVLHWG